MQRNVRVAQVEDWSSRALLGAIACFVVWLVSGLLLTFWQADWIKFANNTSRWLIAPLLVVMVVLWLLSVLIKDDGESWPRRLIKATVKSGMFTIGLIVGRALVTAGMHGSKTGGFVWGMLNFLQIALGKMIVPTILLTVALLIVAYAAKDQQVQDWLDGHLATPAPTIMGDEAVAEETITDPDVQDRTEDEIDAFLSTL